MIISSFNTQNPPHMIDNVIKYVFENRLHKRIKVDKSDFITLPTPP